MSTHNDTYEQALVAVLAALDGLYDDKSKAVTAFDPGADDYKQEHHLIAAGRQLGVTDALGLVTGMLSAYRAIRAGVA